MSIIIESDRKNSSNDVGHISIVPELMTQLHKQIKLNAIYLLSNFYPFLQAHPTRMKKEQEI